jgi:hypothetical protein
MADEGKILNFLDGLWLLPGKGVADFTQNDRIFSLYMITGEEVSFIK